MRPPVLWPRRPKHNCTERVSSWAWRWSVWDTAAAWRRWDEHRLDILWTSFGVIALKCWRWLALANLKCFWKLLRPFLEVVMINPFYYFCMSHIIHMCSLEFLLKSVISNGQSSNLLLSVISMITYELYSHFPSSNASLGLPLSNL